VWSNAPGQNAQSHPSHIHVHEQSAEDHCCCKIPLLDQAATVRLIKDEHNSTYESLTYWGNTNSCVKIKKAQHPRKKSKNNSHHKKEFFKLDEISNVGINNNMTKGEGNKWDLRCAAQQIEIMALTKWK